MSVYLLINALETYIQLYLASLMIDSSPTIFIHSMKYEDNFQQKILYNTTPVCLQFDLNCFPTSPLPCPPSSRSADHPVNKTLKLYKL